MPSAKPPVTATRPEDSPIVWFSELLIAHDRGDYRNASEAQRQLDRLGWNVCRRDRQRQSRQAVAQ